MAIVLPAGPVSLTRVKSVALPLACLALFVLTLAINLPGVEGERQRHDSGANLRMAHQIAHGRIPGYNREPGFATLLSIPLRFADLRGIRAKDLATGEDASAIRATVIRFNTVIIGALVAATFLAGLYLGVSWPLMFGLSALLATGNYWRVLPTHELFSEHFAALFMLGHGILAYAAFRETGRRALLCAAGSSFLLGWLVLTKAMFLYYLPVALAFALVMLAWTRSRRETAILFLALAVPAGTITLAYMTKNYFRHDHFAVTAVRDAAVLTARSGFHLATPEELRAGYAYYAPDEPAWFKEAIVSLVDPTEEDYLKHSRGNRSGFYGDWSRQYARIAAYAEERGLNLDPQYVDGTTKYIRDPEQAAIVKRGAWNIIRSDLAMWVKTTVLMSWKQAFPVLRDWPGGDRLAWTRPIHEHLRLLFLPAAIALVLVLLFRLWFRDWRVVFFAPAAASFFAYAAATHVNFRYGAPIVPFYFISIGLLATMLVNLLRQSAELTGNQAKG